MVSAIPLSFIPLALLLNLARRFPGRDLYEYATILLGNYGGKIIIVFLLVYFTGVNSFFLYDFAYLINLFLLPVTPTVVIMSVTLLIASYMLCQGVECLGRVAAFLFPVVLFFLLAGLLTNTGKINWDHFTPVLEQGFPRVMLGSLIKMSYLGLVIVAGLLLPLTGGDYRKQGKTLIRVLSGSGMISLLIAAFTDAVLGEEMVKRVTFKFFMLFRHITFQGTSLEPFFMFMWVSVFVPVIALFQYAAALGLSRVVATDNYRYFMIPVGLITIDLALLMFDNRTEFQYFGTYIYPPLTAGLLFGVLVLLFLAGFFKGKVPG